MVKTYIGYVLLTVGIGTILFGVAFALGAAELTADFIYGIYRFFKALATNLNAQ